MPDVKEEHLGVALFASFDDPATAQRKNWSAELVKLNRGPLPDP
jgi:hypothetical protein